MELDELKDCSYKPSKMTVSKYTLELSNHEVQDILDDMNMIDDNGNCPYIYTSKYSRSPKCGEEMKSTEIVLATYPMQYPYQCPNCGHEETTSVQYPHIYYEVVDNKD